MKNRNQLSEEELRCSLREEVQYDTEFFLMHDLHPEHQFSEQFLGKMIPLLQDARRGTVKAAEYIMGWQYYAKQGMAAVLICFLLACAAMPETVLAGYYKLIEVVETIYEEYTEFRYRVNEESNVDEGFKPMQLNYLPDGMEELRRIENENSIDLLYEDNRGNHLIIYQKLMTENNEIVHAIDTENAFIETKQIGDGMAEIIIKKDEVYFIWIQNNYRIKGQTNLPKEEMINILNCIEF